MDYEKKYKEALGWMQSVYPTMTGSVKEDAEHYFPELAESEDEKIRKEIAEYIHRTTLVNFIGKCKKADAERWISWLEKQGTSYTKRDVDDAFVESMAFAKNELEKQKPAWSVEDTFKVQRICKYLDEAKKYYADITEVRECIDWLKSLKQRIGWKPSEEQMKALDSVIDEYDGYPEFDSLVSLKNDLKKL